MQHRGKIIDQVKKWKVIDCTSCRYKHTLPLPTEVELKKIYSSVYYQDEKPKYFERNVEDIKWWKTIYADRLKTVNDFIKTDNNRLLEIGSGPGLFLQYAKRNGWKVLGIEPSKEAADFARSRKLEIINEFFQNVEVKSLGKFGAIGMFEFLEHIPNPKDALKFTYNQLEKGGVVCITVPNDFNPLQEVAKKSLKLKSYWIAPPFHINYFDIDSLKTLLSKSGFKVSYVETSFPLEFYLLMGENYIGNDKLGRKIHGKRMQIDLALSAFSNDLKRQLYTHLAWLGIGRDITIYGQKT